MPSRFNDPFTADLTYSRLPHTLKTCKVKTSQNLMFIAAVQIQLHPQHRPNVLAMLVPLAMFHFAGRAAL